MGRRLPARSVKPTDNRISAKRLKQLEAENAKLKKMVAEQLLAIDVMKEIAGKKW